MNSLRILFAALGVIFFGVAGFSTARAVSVDRIEVLSYGSAGAVRVVFTGAVGTGAGDVNSYSISGGGKGTLSVHPDSISQEEAAIYVLYWYSGYMKTGGDVTISVGGVLDGAGEALTAPTSATSTGGGIGGAPGVQYASVTSAAPAAIDVSFSRAMSDTALEPANYTVSGEGIGTLTANPMSVSRLGESSFRLSWLEGSEMQNYGSFVVEVSGAEDLAGNAVAGTTQANVSGQGIEPTLVSATVVDTRTISLVFSEAMDAASILGAPGNFYLGGSGRGTLASSPTSVDALSQTEFRLLWNAGEMTIGATLDVSVSSSATDLAGNRLGSPSSAQTTNVGMGTRPTVVSATVDGPGRITVTFSEDMYYSASYSSGYTISGPGVGTLPTNPNYISSIDARTYELQWYDSEQEMLGGETLMLSVSGPEDLAYNAVAEGPPVLLTAVAVQPTINDRTPAAGAALQSLTEVRVRFTEQLQPVEAGALKVNGSPATTVVAEGFSQPELTFSGFDAPAEGEVTISMSRGAVKDRAGNPNGQAIWTVTLDTGAPYSYASTMQDFRAGTTVLDLDFYAADPGGSGVATTTLWVKRPGAAGFVDTGISSADGGGVLVYADATVNGLYEFATKATDLAGNAEPDPTSGTASVLLNTVENGPFTQPIESGDSLLLFPMTDSQLVRVIIGGVSAVPGATMTVSRTTPVRGGAPDYFAAPGWLLDESLTIETSGTFVISGERITWPIAAENLPAADVGVVTFMWIFDSLGPGATPSGFFDARVEDGQIVLQGGAVFGTLFVGSLYAETGVAASGWMAK